MNLHKLNNALIALLLIALALWAALSLACVFSISLGTDESWVLQGLRSWINDAREDFSSRPIFTSGGPFAVVNLLIEVLVGNRVWAHRLVSWLCLALTMLILYRMMRRQAYDPIASLLALAPLVGAAGTAEVGAMALGTTMGFLLALCAAAYWCRWDEPTARQALVAGLLFGMAACARAELILCAPALLLVSCVRARPGRALNVRIHVPDLVLVSVTLALFVANYWIHAETISELAKKEQALTAENFLGFSFDYPRYLNKIAVASALGPLPLLALASVLPFWLRQGGAHPSPQRRRLEVLLVAMGWILWLGWFFRANIPHMRYLWPALACFAVLLGMGLAEIYRRFQSQDAARLACLLVGLACAGAGIGSAARSIIHGDQDILSWEWSREAALGYFRRFQHRKDQADAIAYITKNIPETDTILCSTQPYPLRYLADRPITRTEDAVTRGYDGRGAHLVITPATGTYVYMTPAAFAWIEAHTTLEAQFGRYSIYKIRDPLPKDPAFLTLTRVGNERNPLSTNWFRTMPK